MPITCSRLSLASSVRRGASSWQGTHQDAQTLTTLTLPLKFAGSSPGTCAPLLSKPCSGGSEISGAGYPSRVDGIREGSPPPSRDQNNAASARKPTSGSTISHERRCGPASDVICLVIYRSVALRPERRTAP